MPESPSDPLFDDVISSYSRAQAIDDGILVDVSSVAKEMGITYPVAMTRTVYDTYVTVPPGVIAQDEAGRLWDILWMFRNAAKACSDDILLFQVHVRNTNKDGTPPLVTLKALVGPGDTPAPVITILLPLED